MKKYIIMGKTGRNYWDKWEPANEVKYDDYDYASIESRRIAKSGRYAQTRVDEIDDGEP